MKLLKNKKLLIAVIVLVIIILLILIFVFMRKGKVATDDNPVIAKVGKESIYQSDLDTEIQYFPVTSMSEEEKKTYLLDKIVQDSILLQESTLAGNLSEDIFNSPSKNYLKRTDLTQEIKHQKETEVSPYGKRISGYLIAVWANNYAPTPFVIETNKKTALQKITDLHEKVKNGTITIQEAGETLKNDTSLAKMDPNYKGNAINEFTLVDNSQTVNNPNFMQELWSLPVNEVTGIHYVENSPDEQFYVFAQVTSAEVFENAQTYAQWVESMKKKYEVQ